MANLTAQRKTEKDLSPYEEVAEPVCVTSTVIFKGAMVGLTAAGLAVKASDATCVQVLGKALEDTRTASGASGAAVALSTIRVESGVQIWVNVGAMTSADIGKAAYVSDDQSVAATGTLVAGIVKKVDSLGVHVLSALGPTAGTSARVGGTQTYTANDLVLGNNPPNGIVYDVPTTAAASTITLPATAVDGTRIFFAADGTKNGHTVQYRDATGPVNLTTALTASKRHLTVCQFLGTKWTANAYVSP